MLSRDRGFDIVAVAREALGDALVARSKDDWWACCPFHAEDTPSFHVRRSTGRFKCFGCGESGDAIDFARRVYGLSYPQAVRMLGSSIAMTPGPTTNSGRSARSSGRPPARELIELLAATVPVDQDEEVATYLRSRALDPTAVAARVSLARALPSQAPCPSWAKKAEYPGQRAQPWSCCGYRLIVPLFAPGTWEPVSLRARRIHSGGAKGVAGYGLTSKNLVMADALGRYLLAHSRMPDDWPKGECGRVLIAEGEPDFWTLATHWPDAHAAPAVLGIVSGSWTPEVAHCIPSGTRVEIRTDADAGGERLADAIIHDLAGRCQLERVTPRARS
ncbi:MAG: hypothetical protein H6697_12695 [Myxococcales bacterium]|nr:hypothetical protein [Myxococcales bacterium]